MKECQNIEWKETWSDDYLKWLCGFANAQGGKLYIGVKNAKKLLEDIPNKIVTTLGIGTDAKVEDRVPNGEQVHQSSPKSSPMSPKDIIIAMILENPKVTIAKMAERLDIGVRAVKKHIAALEEAKIIDRFGPPRTGHWIILESADKDSME